MTLADDGYVNPSATGSRGTPVGRNRDGPVNSSATSGAGRGTPIKREPDDNRPVNPSATVGAGRGYEPARIGSRAMAERTKFNKTEVKVTVVPEPVKSGPPPLPFTISGSGKNLKATPGTISDDEELYEVFEETVEVDPADGTWYFQAIVEISGSDIWPVTASVQWSTTSVSSTPTKRVVTLGTIEVVDEFPVAATKVQFTYGPLYVIYHGGISNQWNVVVI